MGVKKICEVCGKEYETCRPLRITEPFRWQEVACCFEHGSVYFEKMFGSRYTDYLEKCGIVPVQTKISAGHEPEDNPSEETYGLDDELDEEDDAFEDEDYDE